MEAVDLCWKRTVLIPKVSQILVVLKRLTDHFEDRVCCTKKDAQHCKPRVMNMSINISQIIV